MVNKYKIIYKKGGNSELFDKIKEKLSISSIEIMTQKGEIPIKVKYIYDNGFIYEGFVDEEYKPNGEGKMTFQIDYIFEGTFENGEPKIGKITFKEKEKDGWVYKGEVNENYAFNGQGTIRYFYYDNYYQGKWSNNKLIDNVKVKFIDGDLFEGNVGENLDYNSEGYLYLKNPVKGKITYVNKDIYEGFFKDQFIKDGKGTMFFKNEDTFEGTFENDIAKNGKYKFKNGDLFEGNVGENLDYNSEGYLYLKNPVKGKITYVNKDIYEGFFKDQFIKDGKGTMFFKNEDTFEGTFENDIAKNGKYNFKDGEEHNDDNGEIYKNKIFLNNIDYDNLDKEKENIKRILNLDMFKEQSTKILLEILKTEIEKITNGIFIDFDKKIINIEYDTLSSDQKKKIQEILNKFEDYFNLIKK